MSGNALPTVLEEIVAQRRTHLPALRERLSHVDLASVPRSERSLADALRGTNRFIMECKSASPSLGMIREDYRPGDIARIYSRYASAISVLCEPNRFGGDYDHLDCRAIHPCARAVQRLHCRSHPGLCRAILRRRCHLAHDVYRRR